MSVGECYRSIATCFPVLFMRRDHEIAASRAGIRLHGVIELPFTTSAGKERHIKERHEGPVSRGKVL
jgi:hypothetical protein